MILVLCGTQEGRPLVEALSNLSSGVIASTTTSYGAKLLSGSGAAKIIAKPLDEHDLTALIQHQQIQALVDATHPFADQASINAFKACQNTGILYIRFERPAYHWPRHPLIHVALDYQQAAQTAVNLAANNIFLTTGIKTLPLFAAVAQAASKKIIARVIPSVDGLTQCFKLGLEPNQIIAQLGPFSYNMNRAWLQEFKADVLVTKESGAKGGMDAKINAATDLNIPVVIIQRPLQFTSAAHNVEQLIQQIKTGKGSVLIE